MKRVALTQPYDRKQATPERAVVLEAGRRVAGARGLEPAPTSEERGQEELAGTDEPQKSEGREPDDESAHCTRARTGGRACGGGVHQGRRPPETCGIARA